MLKLHTKTKYSSLSVFLTDKFIQKNKVTTIKLGVSSRDYIFGVIAPVVDANGNFLYMEGCISGFLKYSFTVRVNSKGKVQFSFSKTSRFVPKLILARSLHVILNKQLYRFQNPGGGPPKGIHIKAIDNRLAFNLPTDHEGFELGLRSNLYHKDFVDFCKLHKVAGRIR